MNANAPTLRELYAKPRRSTARETGEAKIVRFWIDAGNCYGFLFHHLTSAVDMVRHQRLLIQWALVLKADGQDITSIVMHVLGKRC
jgi:hypothetical protein